MSGRGAVAAALALSTALGFVVGQGLARAPQSQPLAAVASLEDVPVALSQAPASLFESIPVARDALEDARLASGRFVLSVPGPPGVPGPLTIQTTLDAELTRGIWKILDRGRVALGNVVVLDPHSGELLAYVSTDTEKFPPTRPYPAASLIKVITAAAGLAEDPGLPNRKCVWAGNKYRLSRHRVNPPRRGHSESMRRALATSNNQCFAQLAVHGLGSNTLLDAIDRFGFLHSPAPGHLPGQVDHPADAYALGQLGSGLDGTRITPLHAAQLAAILADGVRVAPTWVSGVWDGDGRFLPLPDSGPSARVLTPKLAGELREMLVDTTRSGTAKRAFSRRGRALLPGIDVAGKTGSLSGVEPTGRYEWFAGVAPVRQPVVAVAVVSVQGPLYWVSASQVAAEVFKLLFCPKGVCSPDAGERWGDPQTLAAVENARSSH